MEDGGSGEHEASLSSLCDRRWGGRDSGQRAEVDGRG